MEASTCGVRRLALCYAMRNLAQKCKYEDTNVIISSLYLVDTRIMDSSALIEILVWLVRLGLTHVLLIIAVFYLWHKEVEHNLNLETRTRLPPGHYGWPIVGETLSFLRNGKEFTKKKHEKYGPIFKSHLLGKPVIRVAGAEVMKHLLEIERASCLQPAWPASVKAILGEGALANSAGEAHHHRRSVLKHLLSEEMAASYLSTFCEVLQTAGNEWCLAEEPTKVYIEMKKLTMKVVASSLLGLDCNSSELCTLLEAFERLEANLFTVPIRNLPWPLNGFSKGLQARHEIQQHLDVIMGRCRQGGDVNRRSSLLQVLLDGKDDAGALNQEQVHDCLIEMLFAGHETTAVVLSTIIGLLASHPEVCELILEEDSRTSSPSTECEPSGTYYERLTQRPYLSAVVRESLRLHPPVGAVFRTVTESFSLQGFSVPEGWTVAYSIRDTIAQSELFLNDEPLTFKPQRWLNLSASDYSRDFFPFGVGSRVCVGRHLAMMLLCMATLNLVRDFSWTLANNSSLTFTNSLILRPVDDLPAVFVRKNKLHQ